MRLLQKMVQGSQWANQYPWTARIIIVTSHLILTLMAIRVGFLLHENRMIIPSSILWSTVFVFVLAIYYYPQKISKQQYASKMAFYVRQKCCDGLLVITTFLMLTQQANQFARTNETSFDSFFGYAAKGSLPDRYYEEKKTAKVKEVISPSKDVKGKNFTWKEKTTSWKNKVRSFFSSPKELGNGEKAAYTLLGIIGAVALLFLILMAACNLSCSGAEGLATIVGIGGTILVIALFVLLMKKVYKKPNKQKNGTMSSAQL